MLLGPVRSFSADRRREKRNRRARRKYPTKLVKAAACRPLSPLTTTTGWILRGVKGLGTNSSYLAGFSIFFHGSMKEFNQLAKKKKKKKKLLKISL